MDLIAVGVVIIEVNTVIVVTERDVAPGISKGFVHAPGETKIGTFFNDHVEFLPRT